MLQWRRCILRMHRKCIPPLHSAGLRCGRTSLFHRECTPATTSVHRLRHSVPQGNSQCYSCSCSRILADSADPSCLFLRDSSCQCCNWLVHLRRDSRNLRRRVDNPRRPSSGLPPVLSSPLHNSCIPRCSPIRRSHPIVQEDNRPCWSHWCRRILADRADSRWTCRPGNSCQCCN